MCVTGQHRHILDPFLRFFGIRPDYDLNIHKENQTLSYVAASVLQGMTGIPLKEQPRLLGVQGDTTSVFSSALAAFHLKIPVAHVEAGLRSYDKFQPFPEEANRTFISHIADLNFCPSKRAADNHRRELIPEGSIQVTGNTVVDALLSTVHRLDDTTETRFDAPDAASLVVGWSWSRATGERTLTVALPSCRTHWWRLRNDSPM